MEGGENVERQRQARWDLENLWSVGTKLTPGQYRMVQRACNIDGVSMYALVKRLLIEWLMEWATEHPDRADEVRQAAKR